MRINQKLLLLIVISGLFIGQVNAQTRCKYNYENEDAFSGVISKGTSTTIFPLSLSTNEFWHIGINRENDVFSIVNDIQLGGEYDAYVEEGDPIMFKTADGTIITLYSIERTNPRPRAAKVMNQTILNTQYITNYAATREQIEKFASSSVTDIRLTIGEEVFDQKIKGKHAKDFLNDAKCILQ